MDAAVFETICRADDRCQHQPADRRWRRHYVRRRIEVQAGYAIFHLCLAVRAERLKVMHVLSLQNYTKRVPSVQYINIVKLWDMLYKIRYLISGNRTVEWGLVMRHVMFKLECFFYFAIWRVIVGLVFPGIQCCLQTSGTSNAMLQESTLTPVWKTRISQCRLGSVGVEAICISFAILIFNIKNCYISKNTLYITSFFWRIGCEAIPAMFSP